MLFITVFKSVAEKGVGAMNAVIPSSITVSLNKFLLRRTSYGRMATATAEFSNVFNKVLYAHSPPNQLANTFVTFLSS